MTSTTSSLPFRFLDLPPELRNQIYRLDLVSKNPIALQSDPTGYSGLHRLSQCMRPNLPMVSKQLRLESQRLFLDENEFEVAHKVLKQRSLAPLTALENVHSIAGTELRTLRICLETENKCFGDLFRLKADMTLSKVQGCLQIAKQAYSSTYIGMIPARNQPPVDVCGCEMQRLIEEFNMRTKKHDIVPFLLHLKVSLGVRSSSRKDSVYFDRGVYRSTICWNCPTQVLYGKKPVWFRPFV